MDKHLYDKMEGQEEEFMKKLKVMVSLKQGWKTSVAM